MSSPSFFLFYKYKKVINFEIINKLKYQSKKEVIKL